MPARGMPQCDGAQGLSEGQHWRESKEVEWSSYRVEEKGEGEKKGEKQQNRMDGIISATICE